MSFNVDGTSNGLTKLHDTIQQDIDETQRELREISLMLDQSQVEVEKLSQRNATITMHLQQVENQINDLPVSEVKTAYEAALNAQQRLVGMRGQLEKLQSDQHHLDRYLAALRKIQQALDGGAALSNNTNSGSDSKLANAEMMIQAQETERQRLSRQMHDGPAQALSNFILQTEIAMRLFEVDQEKAREELSQLKGAASTTFQQVRDFIFDLRPMMLDDLGLAPTIKRYCNAFREKNKIEVMVSITGNERRLESYIEVMAFRSLQELLNNVAAHSQASQVKVHLDMGADRIQLMVEDDGKGFDADSALMNEKGLGIKAMRERTEMLGGECVVDSAIGQGVRVTITLPA
ncbi:sensor histidine kinase [bacterium]|nr:sensor histidine kinase [bacterium]MCB2179426.1 sensor histidine kinase [bacterium]